MQGLSVAYVVARHCEVPMVFARAWTAFAVCTLNETDLVDYGALEDNYFERNWVFVFWLLYRLIHATTSIWSSCSSRIQVFCILPLVWQ